MFEYPAILSSSKPAHSWFLTAVGLEHHVILPSSKLTYFFKQLYELFEYHVILSSAKPTRFTSCGLCWFECHVISSSSKPSKRWGFLIDLCSKWAQVLLRFLCAFQAEMYAKILGPVYLRTIRFYSSPKRADLICHTRYVWVPCNFTLLHSLKILKNRLLVLFIRPTTTSSRTMWSLSALQFLCICSVVQVNHLSLRTMQFYLLLNLYIRDFQRMQGLSIM